tara:strand:+ start:12247 stop:14526 length:2280 start_codon:yes stop_codon:yes gene_type:complete
VRTFGAIVLLCLGGLSFPAGVFADLELGIRPAAGQTVAAESATEPVAGITGVTRVADGVEIAPAPSWVEESLDNFVPGDSPAYAEGGVFYHCTVNHARPDEDAVFTRIAFEFQSPAGLEENGTLSWNVDPEFENLQINWIRVYRNGRWIDLLPNVEIGVVDARTDVYTWFYDDSKDVRIILQGVEVGDVLDYGFTRFGSNPVLGDRFSSSFSLGYSVPVGSIEVRLDWPEGKEGLQYRTYPEEIAPDVSERDGYEILEWKMEDAEGIIVDSSVPSNFEKLPWVQFSDWKDWGEVAQWALALYPLDAELPMPLVAMADEIRKEGGSEEVQATKALEFIQDYIRYVAIPVGPHSYQPYPPEAILDRKYGDCKDKSLLLVLLLRELGIKADPALVDTEDRELVVRRLPSQSAFDHVLVRAEINGNPVWMDPTDTHEGGILPHRHFSDFGYALLVAEETDDLTPEAGPQAEDQVSIVTTETFTIKDYNKPIMMEVESVYRGRNADNIRWDLATDGLESFARSYTNYYATIYDQVPVAAPLQVEEDREENEIRIRERYEMPELFPREKDGTSMRSFSAEIIRDQIPMPSEKIRTDPFALYPPRRPTQIIRIEFPDNSTFEDEEFLLENDWFRYEYRLTQEGRVLQIRHDFEVIGESVSPERLNEYRDEVDKVEDYLDYYIEVDLGIGEGSLTGYIDAITASLAAPVEEGGAVDGASDSSSDGEDVPQVSFKFSEQKVSLPSALALSVASFVLGIAGAGLFRKFR